MCGIVAKIAKFISIEDVSGVVLAVLVDGLQQVVAFFIPGSENTLEPRYHIID